MKKSTMRLSWVLRQIKINVTNEAIDSMTNKYPSLDWSIEAVHIFAWVLHKGGWNQANWMQKIDIWGSRTSKTGRKSPNWSKTPTFKKAKDLILEMESDLSPDWVEEVEEKNIVPETREEVLAHYGECSEVYQFMLMNHQKIEEKEKELSSRLEKMKRWIHWSPNVGIGEQGNKTFENLNLAIKNGWFEDIDLMMFIAGNNWILFSYIKFLKDKAKTPAPSPAKFEEPKPEIEIDPRPEEEEFEVLYSVICRIDGCKLPMLGRVIEEENDDILVWLVAPINDEDKFWIKKSLCRVIKEEVKSQKGNISKDQINDSISILVGEQ